jgi:hypothetical protein
MILNSQLFEIGAGLELVFIFESAENCLLKQVLGVAVILVKPAGESLKGWLQFQHVVGKAGRGVTGRLNAGNAIGRHGNLPVYCTTQPGRVCSCTLTYC